jgi:hypothetical protein
MEHSNLYKQVMHSQRWYALKGHMAWLQLQDKKPGAHYKCPRCGKLRCKDDTFELHHKNGYDMLGHEMPDDVDLICQDCHRKQHGIESPKISYTGTTPLHHLEEVDRQPSLIAKDAMLRQIAKDTGIDETTVRKDYALMASTPRPKETPGITITTSEDDLILGLLRDASLVDEFKDTLENLETYDDEAKAIIKAMLAGHLHARDLMAHLGDNPGAMQRILALAADPRKTTPRLLVSSALDAMAATRRRKEFHRIRNQRRHLRERAGSAEADRLLDEINKKLQYRKA